MTTEKIPYKIYLEESEMPKAWYNLRADMKNKPAPLLNPGTLQPMTAQELSGVFCEELVTAFSTASEMAQPRLPVVPGCSARILRPTSVSMDGEGVTDAP